MPTSFDLGPRRRHRRVAAHVDQARGRPWELGLAESHHALVENNLRERVVLRVDGGLKTGLDVMMGALLGADEFGFGTVAMIAVGCIMARICHTNNCPVGVTTQKENLRKKFKGTPADQLGFFLFVAHEVRGILAEMGYTSLGEVVGRADLLEQYRGNSKEAPLHKASNIDLKFVSDMPVLKSAEERKQLEEVDYTWAQKGTLDDTLLAREDVKRAIENHEHIKVETPIVNTDRAIPSRVHGQVALAHGNGGWKGSLHLVFHGCAGQSFGFSCLPGMDLEVRGEANDYAGKSMHGGRIRVRPVDGPSASRRRSRRSSATPACTAPPAAASSPTARRGCASACATRTPRRSSRGRATTAAST